jgi:thioredoxin-related protein
MKYLLIIFCATFHYTLFAQSINFETNSWNEIKQKAKTENKLIFIDCYTKWCKPCKQMDKDVFTNDSISKFYNQNFICVKQDMENNVGSILNKKYSVTFYPTFLFIDFKDSIHYRVGGYQSVQEFLTVGKKVIEKNSNKRTDIVPIAEKLIILTDINEIKNLAKKDFLQAYPSICENIDLLDEKFIKELIVENIYDYAKKTSYLIELYHKRLTIDSIFSATNIRFLASNLCNSDSYLLDLIINNPKLLPQNYKDSVNLIIEKVIRRDVNFSMIFTQEIDIKAYEKTNKLLKKYPFVINKITANLFTSDQIYFKITNKWENYALLYTTEREQCIINEHGYNDVSWLFYENVNNQAYLQKAVAWMQKVIASKPQADYYYTLAHLLAKTNNKVEAIKMQEKAIELLSKTNEDTSLYVEALKKIQKSN